MKALMHKAADVTVLIGQLYREMALSAMTLLPELPRVDMPRERAPQS